jgi:hypothetical protein
MSGMPGDGGSQRPWWAALTGVTLGVGSTALYYLGAVTGVWATGGVIVGGLAVGYKFVAEKAAAEEATAREAAAEEAAAEEATAREATAREAAAEAAAEKAAAEEATARETAAEESRKKAAAKEEANRILQLARWAGYRVTVHGTSLALPLVWAVEPKYEREASAIERLVGSTAVSCSRESFREATERVAKAAQREEAEADLVGMVHLEVERFAQANREAREQRQAEAEAAGHTLRWAGARARREERREELEQRRAAEEASRRAEPQRRIDLRRAEEQRQVDLLAAAEEATLQRRRAAIAEADRMTLPDVMALIDPADDLAIDYLENVCERIARDLDERTTHPALEERARAIKESLHVASFSLPVARIVEVAEIHDGSYKDFVAFDDALSGVLAAAGNRLFIHEEELGFLRENALQPFLLGRLRAPDDGRDNPSWRGTDFIPLHAHTDGYSSSLIYSWQDGHLYVHGWVSFHMDSSMTGGQRQSAEAIETRGSERERFVEVVWDQGRFVELSDFAARYP